MKKVRLFLIVLVVLFILFSFLGCKAVGSETYTGDYPELYSMAINAFLGVRGYWKFEAGYWEPSIEIVETDNYGRRMFVYYEESGFSDDYQCFLAICQKYDDDYVSYYSDYGFLISSHDRTYSPYEEVIEENGYDYFYFSGNSLKSRIRISSEIIDEFKELNDWDKEINENNCERVKITRKKSVGSLKSTQWRDLYEKTFPESKNQYNNETVSFFVSDEYGRQLYLAHSKWGENMKYVVFLFYSDGTYDENKCVLEITDTYNYQDELKAFKELNNWNKPL